MWVHVVVESLQSLQWQQGFHRTVTSFGCIDKFRPENESIEAYLEQIELYFSANEVEEEKSNYFSECDRMGGKTYSILRGLLVPVKP